MRLTARRLAAALAVFIAAAGGASNASAVAAPAPSCPPAAVVPTPDQVAAAQRDALDLGPLWKATKDGRTVYLYGTIHVAQWTWRYPGPQVRRAIEASDVVALELDLADRDVLQRLQKAILRDPAAPALPEALQKRLSASIAAACAAPATFALMRAEMQAATLEVMQGRGFGLYPEFGIDLQLAAIGHGLGKPVRSLETPESQAALVVSDDPAETARSVAETLDDLEGGHGPAMLKRMAADWARGDVDDLDAYATWCGCLDTPSQREDFAKLIDGRNPLMADKIVQWHAQGRSLFVAVGSLHMTGHAGLPELLRARGFQVERVSFAAAAAP